MHRFVVNQFPPTDPKGKMDNYLQKKLTINQQECSFEVLFFLSLSLYLSLSLSLPLFLLLISLPQVWDTAGLERYNSIVASFFRKADVALLTFDLRDPKFSLSLSSFFSSFFFSPPSPLYFFSFSYLPSLLFDRTLLALENWREEVLKHSSPLMILIGSKSDLIKHKMDGLSQQIREFCVKFGVEYFETSSCTGENISQVFNFIGERLGIRDFKNIKKAADCE